MAQEKKTSKPQNTQTETHVSNFVNFKLLPGTGRVKQGDFRLQLLLPLRPPPSRPLCHGTVPVAPGLFVPFQNTACVWEGDKANCNRPLPGDTMDSVFSHPHSRGQGEGPEVLAFPVPRIKDGERPQDLILVCSVIQSCPALCDPIDCSPPGSSIHRILQARMLDKCAISSPGDLPDPRIKPMSLSSPTLTGTFFTSSATWEVLN